LSLSKRGIFEIPAPAPPEGAKMSEPLINLIVLITLIVHLLQNHSPSHKSAVINGPNSGKILIEK